MEEELIVVVLCITILFVVVALMMSSMVVIAPFQQGLEIRMGRYIGKLSAGQRFVAPLVTTVVKIDLRTETVELAKEEVVTKDEKRIRFDLFLAFRVVDPVKAYFEVKEYKKAVTSLAVTTMKNRLGETALTDIRHDRKALSISLRGVLMEQTDRWGVLVEDLELRNIETVGPLRR